MVLIESGTENISLYKRNSDNQGGQIFSCFELQGLIKKAPGKPNAFCMFNYNNKIKTG